MSDWTNKVVLIEKVEHHPNADALDIATVMCDYPVVIKRDEYKPGDKAVYISIDSIVPDIEQYYFLCPKSYEKYEEDGEIKQRQTGMKYSVGSVPEKYRIIKAKKIRDVYSQGMIWPCPEGLNVGDDITELFQLKKWDELEEDNVPRAKKGVGANAKAAPKGWSIPYYDIKGIRQYLGCLKDDEEIVLNEKINGQNFSACHDGNELWVKSRNFYKKKDEDDLWWDAAIRLGLEDKLAKYPHLVFFGELYGNVKGFRYDCEIIEGKLHSRVRFFDVYDTKSNRYLDYDEFVALIKEAGLELAPELYRGVWLGKEKIYPYAEGLTTLGGKHIREGVVLRPVKERFEPRLNSRLQLKLVGEGYNLKK